MLVGGGTLGGAPPAFAMVCWDCWRGRTRADVERARERVVRSVVCMVTDWIGWGWMGM